MEKLVQPIEGIRQVNSDAIHKLGCVESATVESDSSVKRGRPRSIAAVCTGNLTDLAIEAMAYRSRGTPPKRGKFGPEVHLPLASRPNNECAIVGKSVAIDVASDQRSKRHS
jgi:hypothetical protein